MKKILVTGHKGFIGKNLCNFLIKKNYLVTGYEYKRDSIPDVSSFDIVIHLGAISSTTESNIEKILTQNLDFSIKLINECNKFNTHFIYASSAGVYGNGKIFKETSKVTPLSPYAWSKYLFDRYILNNKFKITYQGLRFFNVYGNYEKHKGEQMSVFHKFYKDSIKKKEIYLFQGSRKIYRDFIFVEDCIQIIEMFFQVKESGIWNLGTGEATSFYDIAKYYKLKMQTKIKFIKMPLHIKQNYQYFTKSNNTKLIKTIGKYRFKNFEYFVDQQFTIK